MRLLIVHAHPEPASFSGALVEAGARALLERGHDVRISDLYAARFDPVSDRRNFTAVADGARFRQQTEEAHASATGGYAPELQAEMDKLAWCDSLVLQFPLWWLGMPAIMKGWVDRVFAVGRAYGGGRYFSRGVFAGKRAMCAITIGGSADAYSDEGAYGPLPAILHPIHHGILGFTGFAVAEPFVVHAPTRMEERERVAMLSRFATHLADFASHPVTPPLSLEGFSGLVRQAHLPRRV
jgi:NAD(P)H dehydrogenase (quinone)